MVSQRVVYPDADVTGDWQQNAPLGIDGATYTRPEILGTDTASYLQQDGNANATQGNALQLPSIDNPPAEIELIGTNATGYTASATTTLAVPLPTETIVAGDLIEIVVSTQEDTGNDPGDPTAPGGWTKRYGIYYAAAWKPHLTKFYKIAAGGESGNITITWGTAVYHQGISQVWRGVNQSTPYDVSSPPPSAIGSTGTDPNPPAVTAVTDGAVLTVNCLGNKTGGTPQANVSAGYSETINRSVTDERAFVCCHKQVSAGSTDPGSYSWAVQNWTAASDVLKPEGGSVTAVVIAAVADGTATTELAGSDCKIAANDEIQRITNVSQTGTFTLTFDGQTTAAIQDDASANDIQTALEALSNITTSDVSVDGGALDVAPVDVTFIGAYANTNVAQMTSSADAADLTIETIIVGSTATNFSLETSINVPRSGGSNEPQVHVWSLELTSYVAGKSISVTVADHSALTTWAAVLFILQDVNATTPLEGFGTEDVGSGTTADYGAITPSSEGARILAICAKALTTGYYAGPPPPIVPPAIPSQYLDLVDAIADAATLSVFISAPVDDVAQNPGDSIWSGSSEKWATGLASVKPLVALTSGLDTWEVLDADETTWLEVAGAAGQMYEVAELDLADIPAGAVITSAVIEFAHSSSVRNPLRATLVGITAGDDIVAATEHQIGYIPEPLNQIQQVVTPAWMELSDGSSLFEFSRLGIALISTQAHPQLDTHKVYWARGRIDYEEGGPVVDTVTAPTTAGTLVSWTYSSASGLAQTHWQVMVIQGASGDPATATTPANPLNPSAGEIVYDSGQTAGASTRDLSIPAPLTRGTLTYAVRSWARLPSGLSVVSAWKTAQSDITGTPATGPTNSTEPAFDADTGYTTLDVTAPASVSRAWLIRSTDAGSTWALTEESPHTVTASTSNDLLDRRTPLNADVEWQVSFDDGAMKETSAPVDVGTGSVNTAADHWFLMCPTQSALDQPIEVSGVNIQERQRSIVAEQSGGSIIASSPRLGDRITLDIRTRSASERLAVDALLDVDAVLRLVDILGREWMVRPIGDRAHQLQRWKPLAAENTGLRDAHVRTVELAEVVG